MRQVFAHPVAAEVQGLDVGCQQLLLALVLFADERLDDRDIHLQQGRERADVHDVLEQLALARIAPGRIADFGQRHADDVDVVAKPGARHRLAVVVKEIAAGADLGNVLVPGLRVHRHHQVDAAAPAQPATLADPHLVPGRQALDVGREDVARAHRYAHAQDGLGEQLVGGRRTRTVDVGELDHEVVDRRQRLDDGGTRGAGRGPVHAGTPSTGVRHPEPARVSCSRNFCMSQAPVGQRSAHNPQCRHTSSSLTITRIVFSGPAT